MDSTEVRRFDVVKDGGVWKVKELLYTEAYSITHPEAYASEEAAREAAKKFEGGEG